jgi:hypothetical protein
MDSISEKEKIKIANKNWKTAMNDYGLGSQEETEALNEYRKLLKLP